MTLKYLFKVEFTDGTTLTQKQEDVSSLDPRRNTFYDVLNSKKKVKTFTLRRFLERYSVDLTTGNFKLNGIEVFPEPIVEKKTGRELVVTDRKLIWYMNVQKHFTASYSAKTGKVTEKKESLETRKYFIGWETTINKRNYKRVIGIK